jgi:PAS domain S-box-containing protein
VAYGSAIFLSALAIWISQIFWSFSGDGRTHTVLPLAAVAISAVLAGFLPALLSLVLTTLGVLYYYIEPIGTFAIESRADMYWICLYMALALGAAWLGSALRTALQNGKKASQILEKEVEKRTAELSSSNSELRRLIFELEESRRFLDSLIDNIPLPIYVKDATDLKIIRLNRAARLMSDQRLDYIGKTNYEIFPKRLAESLTRGDQMALTSRVVFESEEVLPAEHFGNRIVAVKKVPLFDRLGKAAYILAIAEDITEKKRAEEQRLRLTYEQAGRAEAERKKGELEEAIRARDTFLSICSHELKTPLTSLKMQAGMIRMLFESGNFEALRSPKVRELVLDADKEINRINRLINDMLDVSRIRSGKLSLRPESVDICEVVHEVVEHFRSDPAFCNIPIHESVPAHIVGVWDRNRIEQIIINLMSNALKYGESKPIQVSLQEAKGNVTLIVEDHGPGISSEDQKRIFQRFERAAASQSISGLGLGLYIVKEIVAMHGGHIRVESEVNQGSRFIVELPLNADAWQMAA